MNINFNTAGDHDKKLLCNFFNLFALLIKPWQNKDGQTFVELHRFLNPFFLNLNQLPAAKNLFKNGAAEQTFGPSYFALAVFHTMHLKI